MNKKVIIITGGNSGIGRQTAVQLAEAGHKVYELSRHDLAVLGVVHLDCDVTVYDQVRSCIDTIYQACGKIDVLISNAGFGISGALEFTGTEDSHRQLEVNLFGLDNAVRCVLPYMREARTGRIIATSSVAAVAAIPFQGWYSVSKAAINTYISALRNEIRPFNVTACAVMPGDIQTNFTSAREKSSYGDNIYDGIITRSVTKMEKDEQNGMNPSIPAAVLCRTALKRRVAPFYSVGFVYKLICLLIKLLPAAATNRIIGWMYASNK